MLKFGSKGENSVVYKCTVRLLEDTEILECEYKVHFKAVLVYFIYLCVCVCVLNILFLFLVSSQREISTGTCM